MQENVGTRMDTLKENLRDKAGVIKERAADAKDAIARGGGSALDRVRGMIQDHPVAAVGLAFGIGYIAVRLARRYY